MRRKEGKEEYTSAEGNQPTASIYIYIYILKIKISIFSAFRCFTGAFTPQTFLDTDDNRCIDITNFQSKRDAASSAMYPFQ